MAQSDTVFAGSIPQSYDSLMVPLIFQAYAANTADVVAEFSPDSVLETAAGSGVVTRALAPRLGVGARVVCCQFGVMFFPDRVAGHAEARRVLRPGGRFVFSVLDRIEENVFADEVTTAVATVFPHDPPLFLARTPHGYHDVARIREELGRAGFSDITISTRAEVSRAQSARHVATAYCYGTPLRSEIEARDHSLLELATDRATAAIASHHGAGPVAGKIQAHVIVAAG